jgi:hypothetical protein
MKKYLAAAVVAVMVFAFAAFAASLNVNAGTLQSGVDHDLACAETADITYAHHVDYHHQANDAWVTEFTVTFDSEDCVGNTMYLTVGSDAEFDGDSDDGLGSVVRDIDAQSVSIPVTDGDSWASGVSISELESVSVTVFSDPPVGNESANTPAGPGGYGWASGIFASLEGTTP